MISNFKIRSGGSLTIRTSEKLGPFVLLGCLFGFACAGLSACSGNWNVPEAAKEVKNPIQPNADTLAYARRIYEERCAHCHGMNGDGKRPPGTTYFYLTQPTKFTDAKIMDAMTDGEIFWKITTGNRPMPSYRDRLSENDRWELVSFLRTFARPPGKSSPPSAAPTQ
jgi:mono/diheme cytochrome c family protein